jgi:CRP-like cAMP-binding protein
LLKQRRVGRNQVLFRQGEPADSLYIIASGRLRISAADRVGNETVLAFLGAGEVVGEMGLLSDKPRSATAAASTDAELLQLRKTDFDPLFASNLEAMRDLVRAVSRRRQTTQQRLRDETSYRHGLVTTVFSPRGGAGTTTLATNLAVALAQRTPEGVALLDLNVLFGHVPVLLNVMPRTSVATMSAVSLRQMDRENLEFYLTRHAESSLRVMNGTLRPEQAELVTTDHVKAAIEVARQHFVHVIIDVERSFSEVNLTCIESTDNLLVICTPERGSLDNLRETQRIFRELLHLPGEPMQYVLNHPTPYASVSPETLETQLGIRLVGSIPFGGDAPARAALEGQPLVTRWPHSPTSKSINRLADLLDQQMAEARELAPASILTIS